MSDNILYSKNHTKPIDSTNGTLVVGNAGCGMSYWVKQNLKAMTDNNIVVVDPQGELLHDTKDSLEQNGYSIKTLDFRSPETMTGYNPFLLISTGKEISEFVDLFFRNISIENDRFWCHAEKMLLTALISETQKKYYVKEKDKYNFVTVYERLKSLQTDDDIAELFANASLHNDFAFFSETVIDAVKTNLAIHLSFCENTDIAKALSVSELNFANINGDEKTALFVITPIADLTYQWLYTQAIFDLLKYIYFDKTARAREKIVRVFINEATNIGEIPLLEAFVGVAQFHGVVFDMTFQSFEQIESIYYNLASKLTSNLNLVYLGTSSYFDSIFLKRTKLDKYAKQLNANKCLLMLDSQPVIDDKLFVEEE